MIQSPKFLMLIGISGSGKSTWLNKLEKTIRDGGTYLMFEGDPYHVVCPDNIRKRLGNVSDQSQNIRVWMEAKDDTLECLVHGTNVILDATNVNTTNRRDFISGLSHGKKLAKIFPVIPELAWERVKRDIITGTDRANVPEEAIYRMYGEYLYTVKVLPSEGFEIL